jgi:hypothetical protein
MDGFAQKENQKKNPRQYGRNTFFAQKASRSSESKRQASDIWSLIFRAVARFRVCNLSSRDAAAKSDGAVCWAWRRSSSVRPLADASMSINPHFIEAVCTPPLGESAQQ